MVSFVYSIIIVLMNTLQQTGIESLVEELCMRLKNFEITSKETCCITLRSVSYKLLQVLSFLWMLYVHVSKYQCYCLNIRM